MRPPPRSRSFTTAVPPLVSTRPAKPFRSAFIGTEREKIAIRSPPGVATESATPAPTSSGPGDDDRTPAAAKAPPPRRGKARRASLSASVPAKTT